ncbi:MAG: chromophore lyase CpcT/CpeT [Geitlerinemataceae cyanobacterium]
MFSNDSIVLAQWMAGEFSNYQQSQDEPTRFAHIRVFFRPLPWEFFSGIGFYSEQVYDYDLWRPYRQGVHRFVDRGNDIYIENYGLSDPLWFAGAARDLSILKTITPDRLQRRCNCSMVFQRDGDRFIGGVEPGNNCLIPKNGRQTYLVSEVELTEKTWVSRDRGFDVSTHEYVWGSAEGPLQFEKSTCFAREVPVQIPKTNES